MKIEKLCEYFNEIGIVDLTSINHFLNVYTAAKRTHEHSHSSEVIKATLFRYLRFI